MPSCADRREQRIDPFAHLPPMRPFPEYPRAAVAYAEARVARGDLRRNARRNVLPLGGTQGPVATQAARERTRSTRQIEPLEYLAQLLVRAQRPHVASVRNAAPLQQLAVACEHNALLLAGDALDFAILDTVVVQRIEAEQAQALCQSAQMRIGDEAVRT